MAIVVNDVVAEIEEGVGRAVVVVAHAGVSHIVMGPQIVVEGDGSVGTGEGAVAVGAFDVATVVEALGDEAPLHRHV